MLDPEEMESQEEMTSDSFSVWKKKGQVDILVDKVPMDYH